MKFFIFKYYLDGLDFEGNVLHSVTLTEEQFDARCKRYDPSISMRLISKTPIDQSLTSIYEFMHKEKFGEVAV
jgi:hypothetical protein